MQVLAKYEVAIGYVGLVVGVGVMAWMFWGGR